MKPVFNQLGIPFAQAFLRELGLPHQIGPPRNIQRHPAQRFIHGRIGRAITPDAGLVAQRLGNRLPQRNRRILCRMVLIDMEIACHLHRHINQRMARKLLHHMIEKANPCGNLIGSRAIQIHRNCNASFRSVALYASGAFRYVLIVSHARAIDPCAAISSTRNIIAKGLTIAARLVTYRLAMTDDTPDSLIPYDEIVQEALRAVVGRVLGSIVDGGAQLPGTHHFYITFKTGAPGVSIPPHLRERFPDEMTIVLQNKFWDLAVGDNGFTVSLSFNQIPAKLQIPFSAITAFVDPAVDFGLQFQAAVAELAPETHEDAENDGSDGPASSSDADSNVVSVDFGRKK